MATTDRNLLYYVDYLGLYRRYASLADIPGIAWHNFSVLLSSYGAMVVYNNELSGIIFQFSRLVGIFSVVGLVRRARRVGMEPGLWFGIFFSLQAILWNFPPDPRLACPMLPLVWLGFREEALAFAGLLRTSWRNEPKQRPVAGVMGAVAGLVLVVAVAAGLYGTLAEAREFTESRRFWWDMRRPAYEWIKRNTSLDATVLSFDDPVLWLATGRRGVTLMQPWESLYTFDQKGLARLYRGLEREAKSRGLEYLLVATRDLVVPLGREEAALVWRELFSSTALDKVWETDDMVLIRLAVKR